MTAVNHLIVHLFIQWLVTSHLIQRPAAFYTFTLFLETKSPYQHEEYAASWVGFGLGFDHLDPTQSRLGFFWVGSKWVGFGLGLGWV